MEKELAENQDKERKFTVTVSAPSDCKRVLSIEVHREEVEKEEAKVFKKYLRDLKIPGFRKGKIPARYIEKNYGDAIHADAVQNLLPVIYEEALTQEGIEPLSHPTFENMQADRGGKVSVDITVEVRPVVNIEGYKGLEVVVKRREIGDAEIDEALENLRQGFSTLRVVDRSSREGDYLIIDYAPILPSGEVDEKGMMRNYPVDLSSDNLFAEFREGLVGMEIGEEKRIAVHYPADFPEKELAGKERIFYASLREVKEKVVPDLDDEFAKRVGEDFENLESLRKRILQDLEEEEGRRFSREAEEKIIDLLIEANPFEVPEVMVENYLTSVIEEDRRRRPAMDDGERVQEIRKTFYRAAVRTVKKYFIMIAVKDQENIGVREEELESRIGQIVDDSGEKAKELRAYFTQPKVRSNLENQLLDEKVLNFLRENADIKAA